MKASPRRKARQNKKALIHCIGADDDLREFYALAKEDSILKYVVDDLYGMHSTSSGDNVFPDAILAILLQMAPLKRSNEMMNCMIRKYGEAAEFDGKTIYVWPSPQKLASLKPSSACKRMQNRLQSQTHRQTCGEACERRLSHAAGTGKAQS